MAKDKDIFEDQWQQVMNEGEVTPPDHVWAGIDAGLSKMEVAQFKGKVLLYKWVAAACLILASSLFTFQFILTDDLLLADSDTKPTKQVIHDNGHNSTGYSNNTYLASLDDEEYCDEEVYLAYNESTPASSKETVSRNGVFFNDANTTPTILEPKITPSIASIERVQSKKNDVLNLPEIDLGWMYGVAYNREVFNTEESYASLWAGISVGAGSFDPSFADGSVSASEVEGRSNGFSSSNSEGDTPDYSSGSSVSGGLNFGKRLNKRIVVSSGLHYSSFNTSSANSALLVNQSTNDFIAQEADAQETQNLRMIAAFSPDLKVEEVSTKNEYQYLTVPFKAGYVILDKKFGIIFNSGISSNILMNARLESSNSDLNKENSEEYKPVYFDFLSSVEFGYTMKDRYRFTIEPNYNQALSDFTRSNSSSSGRPRNFGVSMGVRYNF